MKVLRCRVELAPPYLLIANFIFTSFITSMIHSIKQNTDIPVQITSKSQFILGLGNFTRYEVKDNRIPVGYVDVQDTPRGCHVLYIKNQNPNLYKGFGKIADQIEVEHCMNRYIESPMVTSEAKFNTHILHYKRGKRFVNEAINVFIQDIADHLKKGEQAMTNYLGVQKMYMPINLLNEIKERIKIAPLLKGLK